MARSIDWESRDQFLAAVSSEYGDIDVISRQQVVEVCEMFGLTVPHWLYGDPALRSGRGCYSISRLKRSQPATRVRPLFKFDDDEPKAAATEVVKAATDTSSHAQLQPVKSSHDEAFFIPLRMPGYVPFGHYNDLRAIIRSRRFYPVFLMGLSGNGKTRMPEQICANEKRGCIQVNVTIESDEDAFLGGFRLENGRTVWHDGPVIQAMLSGSVLILDEVDLGGTRLMCLQPILEGRPILLKKVNRIVYPAPGFTIIATANTRGKGSDDGRFIGTNVLNEAFLDRFSITMEQEYPNPKIEMKILNNVLAAGQVEDNDFSDKLVQWADVIRKSFNEGAVSEIISTRRLVHICEAYSIFGKDREKAITLCLARFDADTRASFLDLYKKLDDSLNPKAAPAASDEETKGVDTKQEVPF